MTTAVRTPPHHNTLTCYVDYRCRRPECVQRMRDYERDRRRKQAAGITPFIDAEPVRQHIYTLNAANISAARIATITGLPERTITGFTARHWGPNGRRIGLRQKTTPRVAGLILAVQPDPANAARVNSIASRRRIQALVAIGWPQIHIASRSGIAYSTLADTLRRPIIMATTAEAISKAYEDLRARRPIKCGVTARETKYARTRAASHRWPTPQYWDAPEHPIDDPCFEHDYGIPRAQVIADEGRWLLESGYNPDQVAARLGVSRFYLDRSLREHPAQDDQVAA